MGALQSQLALGFRKKNIPNMTVLWMFPKNRGCFPPQIIHFKRGLPWFSHPFWGVFLLFLETPISKLYQLGARESVFSESEPDTNLWQCTLCPFGLINRKLPKILELWFFPTCYGNSPSVFLQKLQKIQLETLAFSSGCSSICPQQIAATYELRVFHRNGYGWSNSVMAKKLMRIRVWIMKFNSNKWEMSRF